MRLVKMLAAWLTVLASMLLVGCAQVPMADARQDAALKSFPAPRPGMASLYIYRNETFGSAIKQSLVLDGMNVGQSGPKTYFHTDIAPGRHTIMSQGENMDTLDLDALAGRRYFVWQEIKMGAFQARTKLSLVSEDVGRKGVLESALAVSNLPPARASGVNVPSPGPAPSGTLSPAPANRYAGRWAGRMRCGAYLGTGQTTSPEGFNAPIQMTVEGSAVLLTRGDANYSEELRGTINADGSVTASGQGAQLQPQSRPWTTRLQGRFFEGADRFEGSGPLTSYNNTLLRQCTFDLRRTSAP